MSQHGSEDVSSIRIVTTPCPAAALVPIPPTVSCAAVQAAVVGGNVVVVVLSPPSGGIVVSTVDVGLFGLVVWALVVHPATIIVMATAATTANLRTLGIMAPPMVAGGSRNGTLNDDLTPDCASV